MIPLVWLSAVFGGWTLLLVPYFAWWLSSFLDAMMGDEPENLDPQTETSDLFWYRLITLIWMPLQALTLFGILVMVTWSDALTGIEKVCLFAGIGILSGTIGINYAHELMHQTNRFERWLADILLAMTLYGHFRSEHLVIHHQYVGTPRDTVTARYNENFYRFFLRVLPGSLRSAWHGEVKRLSKRDLPAWDRTNPFWRYGALQGAFLLLALILGGWQGLGLFLVQAFVAITQLELVNYVEHYGLTRKHLGDGKYEQVRPHHSWNSARKASNWLLINLQRHSDHHTKPSRRFPVLQTYARKEAPQLPYGYPLMTMAALVPPIWRRRMNPRVRKWRAKFYPEIKDWSAYKDASTPMPD